MKNIPITQNTSIQFPNITTNLKNQNNIAMAKQIHRYSYCEEITFAPLGQKLK